MSRVRSRSRTAPLCDRCIAFIIDSILTGCGLGCLCYPIWKDGIRDGRSFGKGIMGLRVVKHGRREGATVTNSCVRNCCNLCVCVVCITSERRHIGDYLAGTVVVRDR
ncbi:MAG: hypothetical protein ACXADY_12685 [Candidatus Hodarchaeales archaeon]|jgi:uncharacterized RDD family membrane protein YckC